MYDFFCAFDSFIDSKVFQTKKKDQVGKERNPDRPKSEKEGKKQPNKQTKKQTNKFKQTDNQIKRSKKVMITMLY